MVEQEFANVIVSIFQDLSICNKIAVWIDKVTVEFLGQAEDARVQLLQKTPNIQQAVVFYATKLS